MKNDYLKDTIKIQHQEVGGNMYKDNTDFITKNINDPRSKDIVPVSLASVEKGKFYFMFYDLSGKSSGMEKFNPLFIIDWNDQDGTRYLYGVSINFIPVSIRTVFFNSLCNFNLDIIEKNIEKPIDKQIAFGNINFANIYKLLYAIGFEWSIRKFDCKLINKVCEISNQILPTFLTMSTAQLTGVDDGKLIEIWNKKITEQESRQTKLIQELMGDYKAMENELTKAYQTVDKKNDNLEKSLFLIKNIFNK